MTLTQNYPQLKKFPQWLTTLLVILLGITLAKLLWLFLTPELKVLSQANIVQSNGPKGVKQQPNYGKMIADQHLFGVVKKQVVKVKPAPVKAAPTAAPKVVEKVIPPLNVKLYGLFSYSKKDAGFVLLSFKGGPQKVYEKGGELAKNVYILDVLSDKVIISNHGKPEEFQLPKVFKGGSLKANVSAPPVSLPGSAPPPKSPPSRVSFGMGGTPKSPPPRPSESATGGTLSVKNMSKFREEVMANPAKLMDVATVAPYSKNGQFLGFKVTPGKQRRFFRQLGLRRGDVVKDVNGIQLDSAEKGVMLMGEISGAADLNITVLRGTREIQLPTLHF